MRPARPTVRLGLAMAGGMAALACGLADVFRPAGPESVTIIYVGDTVLHRDSTAPSSVLGAAGGPPLDRPHLPMRSRDLSAVALHTDRALLHAQGLGAATPLRRLQTC